MNELWKLAKSTTHTTAVTGAFATENITVCGKQSHPFAGYQAAEQKAAY